MYVGAPMTYHEARDFCRSDNASLPFVQLDRTQLWLYLQQQQVHLRWSEHVWVQDLDYLTECTAMVYRNVEFDDCNAKNAFLCEIDPKVTYSELFKIVKNFSQNTPHSRLSSIHFPGKQTSWLFPL
jgi:hypothetical protein